MLSRLASIDWRNSWYSATWASLSLKIDLSSSGVKTMPALSMRPSKAVFTLLAYWSLGMPCHIFSTFSLMALARSRRWAFCSGVRLA